MKYINQFMINIYRYPYTVHIIVYKYMLYTNTPYTANLTVYIIHSKLNSIIYDVQCTLWYIMFTQYSCTDVHCTLYAVQCEHYTP